MLDMYVFSRLSFPEVLNLNHFVNDAHSTAASPQDCGVNGSGDACAVNGTATSNGPEAANGHDEGQIKLIMSTICNIGTSKI